MTLDQYNRFCASLHARRTSCNGSGAHVWKVGGKVFAIGGWNDGEGLFVDLQMFGDELRPVEGAAWLPSGALSRLARHELDPARQRRQHGRRRRSKDYLAESHRLVAAKLPKRVKVEIGLGEA